MWQSQSITNKMPFFIVYHFTNSCNKYFIPSKLYELKFHVSEKAQLNNIVFNKTEPIIIVGDSSGNVNALKLSPNLRKRSKDAQLAIYNNDMAALHQAGLTTFAVWNNFCFKTSNFRAWGFILEWTYFHRLTLKIFPKPKSNY